MNRFLPIVCLLVVSALFGTIGAYTGARAAGETDVLQDLQKDPNFDAAQYPDRADDYSLALIQIAETTADQLLVYVYQPSAATKPLTATSITFSTAINESLKYVIYPLMLLHTQGTLQKYAVQNFTVKTDALRYYEITELFRKWDESIDAKPTDDNTVGEVSYPVGELWTASTVDGVVSYTHTVTETITVTDKHVGFIRYPNGYLTQIRDCDSHYVAFSTDRNMDRLMDADVYFVSRVKRYTLTWTAQTTYEDPIEQYVTLSDIEEGGNPGGGIFAHKYTWKRIEKVSDFVKNPDNALDDETKKALNGKDWVLRFFESTFQIIASANGNYSETNTEVTDVTILRLKFETDGKTYNLGVVDNKQQGDGKPDNGQQKLNWLQRLYDVLTNLFDWKLSFKTFRIIFWCIVGVIGLALFMSLCRAIFGHR